MRYRPHLRTLLRSRPAPEQAQLLRTAQELRARGLSYQSICVVLELYENLEISDWQLRAWLRAHGEPKDVGRAVGPTLRHIADGHSVRRAA